MILNDFTKALSQMTDPRFRNVLLKGVGLTFGLLFVVFALVSTVAGWLTPDSVTLPLIGEITWADNLVSWASLILMFGLSIFLMVPVASAFTSLFLDDVAQAVEDQHYPALPRVQAPSLGESLRDGLNFLGILIAANIAALVLYVLFIPIAAFIFWGLNGFLLGREYFTLAAMRRVGRSEAKVLRKRYSLRIWIAGFLMAIPLSVPLLNLVIPILGAATFTHLFHRLVPQGPSGQTSRDRGH